MAFILLTFMLVGSVRSTLKSQDFHEEKAHEVYDNFFQESFKIEDNLLGTITKGKKKEIEIYIVSILGQTKKDTLQRMRREIETTTSRLDQTDDINDEKQNGQDHKQKNIGQESKEEQKTESQHKEHNLGQDIGNDDVLRNTLKRAFKIKYQMNVDGRNYKEDHTEEEPNIFTKKHIDQEQNEECQENKTLGHQDTKDGKDNEDDSDEFDENGNEIGSSEEPFINKTVPIMFPVNDDRYTVQRQRILMGTPYQKRGNLIRFPSNYKQHLRRVQKYAKGVNDMQDMVAKEIFHRLNQTSIALTVHKQLMKKLKRKRQLNSSKSFVFAGGAADRPTMGSGTFERKGNKIRMRFVVNPRETQRQLARFIAQKRGNATTWTKQQQDEASQQFFFNFAKEAYRNRKREGLVNEEDDAEVQKAFKELDKPDKMKVMVTGLEMATTEKWDDMNDLAHETLKQSWPGRKIETYKNLTKQKEALHADKPKTRYTGKQRNKIEEYEDYSTKIKLKENTDDEHWLFKKIGQRLTKKQQGKISEEEEERQFNEDLDEFLRKRKTIYDLTYGGNKPLKKDEIDEAMDEHLYLEAIQEYRRKKKLGLLNDEEEEQFHGALANFYEKKKMKEEDQQVTIRYDKTKQWDGTIEDFMRNRVMNKYEQKKQEGTLTEDEEATYQKTLKAFGKIGKELAAARKREAAQTKGKSRKPFESHKGQPELALDRKREEGMKEEEDTEETESDYEEEYDYEDEDVNDIANKTEPNHDQQRQRKWNKRNASKRRNFKVVRGGNYGWGRIPEAERKYYDGKHDEDLLRRGIWKNWWGPQAYMGTTTPEMSTDNDPLKIEHNKLMAKLEELYLGSTTEPPWAEHHTTDKEFTPENRKQLLQGLINSIRPKRIDRNFQMRKAAFWRSMNKGIGTTKDYRKNEKVLMNLRAYWWFMNRERERQGEYEAKMIPRFTDPREKTTKGVISMKDISTKPPPTTPRTRIVYFCQTRLYPE